MVTIKNFNANINVLVRLANAFSEQNTMKKTHMHASTRIRWNSFGKYLLWLLENGYVEHVMEQNEEKYRLTETGREMFKTIIKLQQQIHDNKPTQYN